MTAVLLIAALDLGVLLADKKAWTETRAGSLSNESAHIGPKGRRERS